MWIFTEAGFVDVTVDDTRRSMRKVSGWSKEHLGTFFQPIAAAPPIADSSGSYPHQVTVPSSWVLAALMEQARAVAYTDFHGAITDPALQQWVGQALRLASDIFTGRM